MGYEKVNLDVTTLIALTSDLSHGEVAWAFKDAALEQQVLQETEEPVLKVLHEMLQGATEFAATEKMKGMRLATDDHLSKAHKSHKRASFAGSLGFEMIEKWDKVGGCMPRPRLCRPTRALSHRWAVLRPVYRAARPLR